MYKSLCFFVTLLGFTMAAQEISYQAIALDKDFTENANAVVRLDDMTVDILSQDNMVIRSKRVVTVLNKRGNKHLHAFVGYSNSRKVKYVRASIYDAFGKEIKKIKEKDFKDVSAVSGGTLYSDSRVKYLKYTPISYLYTVVFEKEIQTKNTAFVPNWYFLDGFQVSVEKSRYTLNFPNESLRPQIKEKNINGYDIKKEENTNFITYTGTNIKSLKKEELSPAFSKLVPQLMLRLDNFYYEGHRGAVTDWNELGRWVYDNLLKGRDELTPEVEQHIQSLVKDAQTDLEKAMIVYEYVQANTRYISVQVGIGGIQPIKAIEVDKVKYGDCKGLSNYTHALLNAVGVKSYYVHVEAGSNKIDFEEDFATLSQGNHAILAIPIENEYTWIDCTSQTLPFGFIGDFTDGRRAFVIKDDGGEVVETKVYKERENFQKINGSIQIDTDGSMRSSVKIETKGIQYNRHFGLENLNKEEVLKRYRNNWSEINNLVLDSYEFKNNKKDVVFIENVSIQAKNYATISGDRLLFYVNGLNRNNYVPKRYRTRNLPFEVQRGFYDEDTYTIILPKGYAIEALPGSKSIISEFGAYVSSISKQEDGTLKYYRSFYLKEGDYPKEKYNDYRSFRREVSKSENAKAVLLKS